MPSFLVDGREEQIAWLLVDYKMVPGWMIPMGYWQMYCGGLSLTVCACSMPYIDERQLVEGRCLVVGFGRKRDSGEPSRQPGRKLWRFEKRRSACNLDSIF